MKIFINDLLHTLNHLSDGEHSAFHLKIRDAAKMAFAGVTDDNVEDWLHTEDMHANMKGKNPIDIQDYRCDTDRTMGGTLVYLNENNLYSKQLENFRSRIKPELVGLGENVVFTIDNIEEMPWFNANMMHGIMNKEMKRIIGISVKEKVFPRELAEKYISAANDVAFYYSSLGGELLAESIADANKAMREIHSHLANYLKRARAKTSPRHQISSWLLTQMEKLISVM